MELFCPNVLFRLKELSQMIRNPLKSKITFAALALCVAAFSSVSSRSHKKAVFPPDKGNFATQPDGQPVGQEEFEFPPGGGGGAAKGTPALKVRAAPASHVTGSLTLQPDGAPIS